METEQAATVLTIGHSTHPYESFLRLLKDNCVTAIADVRTSPFSRHHTQFNKDVIENELKRDGIAYVFLGKELGGRPSSKSHYSSGVADYEKMAADREFAKGLDRVVEGAGKYRIALMCSEHDPLDCHRCLLVGRALADRGLDVRHILSNGDTLTHQDIEQMLLKILGDDMDDLFASRDEVLATAYRSRARKVAYEQQAEESQRKNLAAE